MTTPSLVRRSLVRTMRHHRMITVLLVLLILGTVAVSWVAGGATYGTAKTLTEGLGPRQIEVIQGYGGPESPQLDAKAATALSELDHVESVFRSGSSGIDPPASVQDSSTVGAPWWLMPQNPLDDRMQDADGQQAPVVQPGQMLVPSEHKSLVGSSIEVGTTLALDATNGRAQQESFDVVGTYDPDTVQGEVPGAVFIDADQFDAIQVRALPPGSAMYSSIYVYVDDVASVASVQAQIESLGYGARSAIGSGVQLDQAKQGLALTSLLLITVTVLGSLFAGTSVSSSWMTSRVEEIGLFRSLGWTRQSIVRLYLGEAVAFALAVTTLGTVLGAGAVLLFTAAPTILSSVAGVTMDAQAVLSQSWVVLVPLILVPLGFALGTTRRAVSLLRTDTDALLRQI